MRTIAVLGCLVLLMPGVLLAQAKDDTEQRFRALEERIRALEAEIQALKATQATTAAPLAASTTAPATVVQTPPADHHGSQAGQLPVYGGASSASKALNPDIGMIGNLVGAVGHNTVNPLRTLALQESELSLQAIVDPYARADFFLAIGEDRIEVEEGYITFPALPGGFVAKAGKMRAMFGRTNTFHNHTLPWVDRPLVAFDLMGGELDDPDVGIKDAGFSVSRILPSPKWLFLEATGEVFRGDSGTLFKSSQRSDVSTVGHLKAYRDITESTNLELGGSYARGHNDLGSNFITQVYALDGTLRWRPLRRSIYHSFAARTELVWSQRDQIGNTQHGFGFFVSSEYQLSRRRFMGGRYDRSDRARNAALRDSGGSFILTYWPSEFSQIRGQFRHTQYAEGQTANELLFQFLFTLGAHGAHPF